MTERKPWNELSDQQQRPYIDQAGYLITHFYSDKNLMDLAEKVYEATNDEEKEERTGTWSVPNKEIE